MESITLQTGDTIVTSGDSLGQLQFAASAESDGSASRLIAARVYAQAEGSFGSASNPCSIILATASADASAATDKIKITDKGYIVPMTDESFDIGDEGLRFRDAYFARDTTGPTIQLANTETAPDSGVVLGSLDFYNSHTTAQTVGASIKGQTGENLATDGEIAFHVGPYTDVQERLRIDKNGNIIMRLASGIEIGSSRTNANIWLNTFNTGYGSRIGVDYNVARSFFIEERNGANILTASNDANTITLSRASSELRLQYNQGIGVADNIYIVGSTFLGEQASAHTDYAGSGQLWVKNDVPCTLYYTDDLGTDYQIGGAGLSAGVTGGSGIIVDANDGIHYDPSPDFTWEGRHIFNDAIGFASNDTILTGTIDAGLSVYDDNLGAYEHLYCANLYWGSDNVDKGSLRFDVAETELNIYMGATKAVSIDTNESMKIEGTHYIKERAAAAVDKGDYGQIWVKNDVPDTLMFTDDAGNDFTVAMSGTGGGGGGDVTKVGTPVDNQIGVWTGDGTLEGDANLTWDGTTLDAREIFLDAQSTTDVLITARGDASHSVNLLELQQSDTTVIASIDSTGNMTLDGDLYVGYTSGGGTIYLDEGDGLGTDCFISSTATGYNLNFYTRYNASKPAMLLSQNKLALQAAARGINLGDVNYAPNIRAETEADQISDLDGFSSQLNAGTATDVLHLVGCYGGTYAASTSRHNGTGGNFLAGDGIVPSDANADGGVGGSWSVRLGNGGAGAGTGADGLNGVFRVKLGGASQPDIFNVDGETSRTLASGVLQTTAAFKTPLETETDGATVTFDLDTSNLFQVTLGGNRTLALSNADPGQRFIVRLVQDGTGSRTVTWFSTIKWPGALAPTLTTTAGKTDVFAFICTSAGNYDGYVIGYNL